MKKIVESPQDQNSNVRINKITHQCIVFANILTIKEFHAQFFIFLIA